jgi:regulator of cell morphogenesis and NO signaling
MVEDAIAALLEREHHDVDRSLEQFISAPDVSGEHATQLQEAITALRRHIYLEEQYLFPALREDGLLPPVLVMLREHGQIWQTLDLLEEQLRTDPVASLARDSCRRLLVQLLHHNLKEERILYPRADDALTTPQATNLIQFLTTGGCMPTGWTCAKAQA